MRGFPLLRLGIVALALLLLGLPVWMVTRDVSGPEASVEEPGGDLQQTASYEVVLTASSPALLGVRAAKQPTLESADGAATFEASLIMNATQPEDLAVFAKFDPAAGRCALRAEVRVAGKMVADSTFWGEGLVEDVVLISAP